MACCLLCFDDGPTGSERDAFGRTWQTGMKDAPCAEPLCYLGACCCWGCAAAKQRQEVLGGSLQNYSCCQGYFNCCCFKAGTLGEDQCPEGYLCVEAFCCTHFAIQANRFYMMDTRQIQPDPCDNQIIRCYNALLCLTFLFEFAACITGNDELSDAATILRMIVDLMYATIMPCMIAQVHHELNAEKSGKVPGPGAAPTNLTMNREPPHMAPGQPVQQMAPVAQPAMQPAAVAVAMPVGQPQPFMVQAPAGIWVAGVRPAIGSGHAPAPAA